MTVSTASDFNINQTKTVGLGLGIGIFLLPFVFAWTLLRPGYSTKARLLAFSWLGAPILIGPLSAGSRPAPTVPAVSPAAAPEVVEPKWGYGSSNDELHGPVQFASLQSDDTERFKGFLLPSWLDMTLFPSADDVTIALKTTKGGVFMCNGTGDITIKLDEGSPRSFGCEDSSTLNGTVYIKHAADLAQEIQHSKRMVLEAKFIVEGPKRFHFTTLGLKPTAEWK